DVLAEDHDVDLLRVLDRRADALEVAHRADAGVEVELLAQRDVQRADAAADRRRERAFDGDLELANGLECLVRHPLARLLERLLAGEDLHPVDAPLAAVRAFDGGVEAAYARTPDVGAGAVALDERDDRV